ncbi:MAG: flagellar motor protein MotB, partial [Planctomycetota bacterium]
MAKKKYKASAGAPAWMVTYGDMMTLLLCFFVLLVAMSEIKQEDKFLQVVESLRHAFGYETTLET